MTNEKDAVGRTREELKQEIHAYKDELSILFTATFMERSPMTNYQDQHQGRCKHEPWVEDGRVWLANDDDSYYKQDFINREEVEELISKLRAAADEAWPND